MTSTPNIYHTSLALQQLQSSIKRFNQARIAFLDIDFTLTGNHAAAQAVRQRLQDDGYVLIFVSSRTEETMMSEAQRRQCKHFERPEPLLRHDPSGKYAYEDPAHVEPLEVLDPHIIAGSLGTAIYVQQENGYMHDTEFSKQFGQSSHQWRNEVLKMLTQLNADYIQKNSVPLFAINPIEDIHNYENRVVTVAPPDFRIQLFFESRSKLNYFEDLVSSLPNRSVIDNIRITDDADPKKHYYFVYLTPRTGGKTQAISYLVNRLSSLITLEDKNWRILIAGDSWPDLESGLYINTELQTRFLLVGGSNLTPALNGDKDSFASKRVKPIYQQLCLNPTKNAGCYYFDSNKKRFVVIGSEFAPDTSGPETLLAYLNSI